MQRRLLKFSRALTVAVPLAGASMASADNQDPVGQSLVKGVSTFFSGSGETVSQFGGLNFSVDVSSGGFPSLKPNQARLAAKGWTKFLGTMNKTAKTVGKSLPYRVAPAALLAFDTLPDVAARYSGGDCQGATAGIEALALGTGIVAGTSTAMGAVGAAIGGTIGSSLPVVGTVVGAQIGGAVGKIAGGFIAATTYDLLIKDHATAQIEGAIAPIFDMRSDRVRAFEEKLRMQAAENMIPIREGYHRVSQGFDLNSVELMPPPSILPTILRYSAIDKMQEKPVSQATPDTPEVMVALANFDTRPVSGKTVRSIPLARTRWTHRLQRQHPSAFPWRYATGSSCFAA